MGTGEQRYGDEETPQYKHMLIFASGHQTEFNSLRSQTFDKHRLRKVVLNGLWEVAGVQLAEPVKPLPAAPGKWPRFWGLGHGSRC